MNTQRNPNHVDRFAILGYTDLGWANGWGWNEKEPEAVTTCQAAKHRKREVDNALYLFRGTDTIYICDECKTFFHVDSSD